MSLEDCAGSDERFSSYVEGLAGVIGHADRVKPLRDLLQRADDAVRAQER